MQQRLGALVAALILAAAWPAHAQPTDSPAPAAAAEPTTIRILAGTEVQLELTEALSSRTSQQEQTFGLRLAEPIVVDGRVIVSAGAIGGGEVIDAHRSAFGGRQGRLIISGRFIEIGGQRVRIRGMQITAAGDQRTNTALAVSMIPYAGIAGIFVQGGEIEIPAGARGAARLAADVDIPLEAVPGAALRDSAAGGEALSTSAEAPQPSTSGENQQ